MTSKKRNCQLLVLQPKEKTDSKNTTVLHYRSDKIGIGIPTVSSPTIPDQTLKDGTNNLNPKKSNCLEEIERLKQNREERRKKMDDMRKQKTEREQFNEAQGIKVDVDFQVMVEQNMRLIGEMQPVRLNYCLFIL